MDIKERKKRIEKEKNKNGSIKQTIPIEWECVQVSSPKPQGWRVKGQYSFQCLSGVAVGAVTPTVYNLLKALHNREQRKYLWRQ